MCRAETYLDDFNIVGGSVKELPSWQEKLIRYVENFGF